MKKILLVVLGIILFLPNVYAGTAYVDNIDIDAIVNTDGSMTVVETINWDIDEELNGLYRDFIIFNPQNETNSASGIIIDSVKVNGKEFKYAYSTLKNGEDLKYNINDITNGKQVKIFTPSEDENKTTTITYTLYDVVVKYNDIAELYWNFIGDGWEYGIDNVDITITLPETSNTLKVFGHGPLNGVSNITGDNSVTLNVSGLRSNEIVDARVLFDTTLVDTTKVVYETKLESILAEEKVLAEEANLRRENVKKAFTVGIIITIISVVLPIVIYLKERKKVSKAEYKGKYYRELVEDYGPTVMTKVLYPTSSLYESYNMLATLLDLVRKKYIEIEPVYKKNGKKPYDYNLKLINENITELNEIEQYFIKELVFVDVNEITLKEITKKNTKTTKAHEKAIETFSKWSKIITKVAKEKELLKEKATGIVKPIVLCVLCLLLIIATFIMGCIINDDIIMVIGMVGIFIGIFELVFIFIGLTDLNSRTEKGIEHNAMWKAFRRYLLDFSKLDEHDYKSLVIWEHYLVYAAALGITKQVIKELKIVFPNELNDNNMYMNYATIGLLTDSNFNSFSSSFATATGTAFSSSSGSGGGFSGGAGGRRRRWRRWWFLKPSKN